jgi:ParB family transcriptional regulator, chromosome partitioning protein
MQLMKELSATQEEVAKIIGKKRSTVANFLRLLQLTDEIKEAISSGVISMAHAKVLLSCPESKKEELFSAIKKKNLSVREAEAVVTGFESTSAPKKEKRQGLHEGELVKRLERHFGTKIQLEENKGKGKVSIHFYSLDDLERILELCQI